MKPFALILFLNFLVSFFSFSQNDLLEIFLKNLTFVNNIDSAKSINTRIDSIEKNYFGDDLKPIWIGLDSLKSWKILFSKDSGWEQVVGDEATYIEYLFVNKNSELIKTGEYLAEIFDLKSTTEIRDPLNTKPEKIKLSIGDRYNQTFAMISEDKKYLLIKTVLSYPNDKEISSYHEVKYFFISE